LWDVDSITFFQEERTRLNICLVGCGASFQNLVGEKLSLSISLLLLLSFVVEGRVVVVVVVFADVCCSSNQSQRNTLRPSTSFKHKSNIRLHSLALISDWSCNTSCLDDDDL